MVAVTSILLRGTRTTIDSLADPKYKTCRLPPNTLESKEGRERGRRRSGGCQHLDYMHCSVQLTPDHKIAQCHGIVIWFNVNVRHVLTSYVCALEAFIHHIFKKNGRYLEAQMLIKLTATIKARAVYPPTNPTIMLSWPVLTTPQCL